MKYDELLTLGRTMEPDAIAANLVSLAGDPRFAAVVAMLENNRIQFVEIGCKQNLAKEPGTMAHCQGSVYAMGLIQAQLRQALNPPHQPRPSRPEED